MSAVLQQSNEIAVPAPEPRHLDGIDALRGVAVLLVVLHHIELRFRLNGIDVSQLLPTALTRVLFRNGYYAVIAFFVISGFLITRGSLQRWGALPAIELKHFYGLRIARIWPCLLLLVAVLSALHLAAVPGFIIDPQRASLAQAAFAALTLHFNWLEGHYGYLPGPWDILWSLSVEETFYLLFPALCVWLRRPWWLLLVAAALIVAGPLNRVALGDQEPWSSYAYLSCMDAIALGCLAGWLVQQRAPSVAALRGMLVLGAAAMVLVLVLRRAPGLRWLAALGLDVTVLGLGVALVLLALARDVGNRALTSGTGWLQWLGRHSYEMYLLHMLPVMWGVQLFTRWQPDRHWIPLWYVAIFLSGAVAAALLARCYSVPLNRRLRSGLPARISPRGSALAPRAEHVTQPLDAGQHLR